LLFQDLSESSENIKNGSVAFVQTHFPAMNGEGMYWERKGGIFAFFLSPCRQREVYAGAAINTGARSQIKRLALFSAFTCESVCVVLQKL